MEKLFKTLLQKYEQKNIDIYKLKCVQKFLQENPLVQTNYKWKFYAKIIGICCSLFAIFICYKQDFQSQNCALELPRMLNYAFRPPENCAFCAGVTEVEKVRDISKEEFEKTYAYSAKPVVIEDATVNWTAMTKFDYWYFRDVYTHAKRRQKILDCQFLPYKTGFNNIFEALDMPEERVNQQPGTEPWYFGWSNCNAETVEEFRRHYSRPYFLPDISETNAIDWFFIGTAGLGAQMHVDDVRLPSWQAQMSGKKLWILAPPPECYFKCQQVEVVVNKGDIIVLDTNKWYHQTFVQPGELSLTVGAEYD